MRDTIDYGHLMHRAMRGLIQTVLTGVAKDGLPGDHHFFITFETSVSGVKMASWLHERYPAEMTLVLQHWFADLTVTDAGFSVTLNFGNNPENITVPFDAVRTFVDPSVEFGLRFETTSAGDDDEDEDDDEGPDDEPPPPPKGEAQIVRLDKFRK
jgi:uncharacterized protein